MFCCTFGRHYKIRTIFVIPVICLVLRYDYVKGCNSRFFREGGAWGGGQGRRRGGRRGSNGGSGHPEMESNHYNSPHNAYLLHSQPILQPHRAIVGRSTIIGCHLAHLRCNCNCILYLAYIKHNSSVQCKFCVYFYFLRCFLRSNSVSSWCGQWLCMTSAAATHPPSQWFVVKDALKSEKNMRHIIIILIESFNVS